MRLATFNVNGIRAAQRRGFSPWIQQCVPDVVALQEVRCPLEALPVEAFAGFHVHYTPGNLAGRNGVAVLTRIPPAAVRGWGGSIWSFDPTGHAQPLAPAMPGAPTALARELRPFVDEGRYLEIDLADHALTVACLYLPKGDSPLNPQTRTGEPLTAERIAAVQRRYDRKMSFLAGFARQLSRSRRAALAAGRQFVVVGDFNIAHTPHDVKNWRAARTASGFLPEERAWLDAQLNPRTLVDVIRRLHPDQDGPYSWWSWMGQAFARDTGWRIDYQLASPALARTASTGFVDRQPEAPERISDHAPVVVDYDY
ncbi:exodeoxyribonuclease III [Propionibacterium cyclohexanicum]|uniref:exodeoxyribonuclease III n=1 Tax=Propionibacterium cyclohexanicum TaxID=64702 RepID=UPI001C432BF8|nr:exodeoxyribonuclease III [Propionibacterium cyclohexanicum]